MFNPRVGLAVVAFLAAVFTALQMTSFDATDPAPDTGGSSNTDAATAPPLHETQEQAQDSAAALGSAASAVAAVGSLAAGSAGTAGAGTASTTPTKSVERDGLPQTCRLGTAFESFLKGYLAEEARPSGGADRPLFVYSCEPHKKRFCGGTGDRFRGIISVFFLAMVTGRSFKLHSPYPAPYTTFFDKAYLDWEIDEASASAIPVDLSLMRLNKHKHYMKHLASGAATGKDLRVQSNSFDVTDFAVAQPRLRDGIKTMGLAGCNISCYYGCLWDLLFDPSKEARSMVARATEARKPYVAMQVRVSGPWATGLAVQESWRTHPAAFPYFWETLDRVFADPKYKNHSLFVTTDAPKFIDVVKARYGHRVFLTPGEQFNHTDSSELHALKPEKYKAFDSAADKVEKFKLTLLNNYLLGEGDHMVMAQSGFGDTAFWRTKKTAHCLFVDISNYRTLWRHTLAYPKQGKSVSMGSHEIISVSPP